MKAIRDYNQGMLEAEERGLEKGRMEGHREGRIEGHREGRLEGQKFLIESMLGSIPVEQIAQITKMSVSDIKKILES